MSSAEARSRPRQSAWIARRRPRFSGIGATRKTLRLDLFAVLLVQIPLCLVATFGRGSRDALWSAIATSYALSAIIYGVAYARSRDFWPRRKEADA